MDLDRKEIIYLNRAKNELDLANAIFKISTEAKFKLDLELKESLKNAEKFYKNINLIINKNKTK